MDRLVNLIEQLIEEKISVMDAAGHEHWFYEARDRIKRIKKEIKHELIILKGKK